MKVLALAIAPLLFCAGIAHAEVSQSAADGFLIVISNPVGATPAKTYAALIQPQHWWNGEHTWSGEAANLSLKPEAGGCFCEHWAEGSAEHGRVVMALPGKLLRLDAALGPLQEFALTGALSFWIKTDEDGATQLNVEYRVNGAGASGLDAFAPKVDEVLSMQVARLVRYIDSGDPEPPPPPPTDAQANASARAAMLGEWARDAAAAQKAKPKEGNIATPKPPEPAAPPRP
jgi:uncharacterized protein YndB with AHSA1/START domain